MNSIPILVVVIEECFKLVYRAWKVGGWCSMVDKVAVVGAEQGSGDQIYITSLCFRRQKIGLGLEVGGFCSRWTQNRGMVRATIRRTQNLVGEWIITLDG